MFLRRNLSPDDFKIVSGRIYNRRKKAEGGRSDRDLSGDQIDPPKTAETVADELGVSGPTIKRNGQRAEVYDAMLDIGDDEAAEAAKVFYPQNVLSRSFFATLFSEKSRKKWNAKHDLGAKRIEYKWTPFIGSFKVATTE